ncbi:MAG: hypothetical protein KC433_10225 [Anaerolineales bacterium]|nr:hypothetical protein [Anaerolineales bacterium]MCB8939997.1 hypothetical protein [Ardenticatenaceae bacterium]
MFEQLPDFLALLNDILEAVIVIFGTAVVLYHLGRSLRDPVMRAFCALITFVVIAFLAELLVSRTIVSASVEGFLRFQWLGIAMVPAAQFHLSSALLSTTGALPRRRRFLVPFSYILGITFLGLALLTDLLVTNAIPNPLSRIPHLDSGPVFPIFAFYFWLVTAMSIYNVWRARQRCITRTTRQRMTSTLLAFLAAPLGVFPYLLITGSEGQEIIPLWLWPIIILGNLVVGLMFGVLTAHLAYFGTASPDRVVRVRLFKFMARVPLAGSIVLLVYVLVSRNSPILGLPAETALGFSLVATVMLVEWAIHAYKRPLERVFQLNNDPDVRTIQKLSERLLTTRDLQQFLDSILAATCEALRTPTSFVAAITPDGPQLEAVVGPLAESGEILQDADWRQLAQTAEPTNGDTLKTVGDFFVWRHYWIRPLHSRQHDLVLGILGIRARSDAPDLSDEEEVIFGRLLTQAAQALEDRILQQEVFATVEGLLPQITAIQQRRSEAAFGGLPVLAQETSPNNAVVNDPEFNSMVRDALTHYWGGPKLTTSPLMRLQIVQQAMAEHENNPTKALRAILNNAIELQKPEGERNMTTAEWILYNILELKFVQGQRVRDVARRLAMSESDLYRKQRVAIENVARTIGTMELASQDDNAAGSEEEEED